MILSDLTKREQMRMYKKIRTRLESNLDGGGTFGMDWRTIGILFPQMKSVLFELCELIHND